MIPRRPNSIQDTRNRDELEILAGLRGSTDQHALRRGMLREVEARIAEITAQANRLASQIASAGELAARRGQDLDAEDQRRRDLRELRAEDRRISERVDEEISEAIDEIIIARQEIEAIEEWMDDIEIDIETAEQIVTTVEALRDENIAYKNASEAAKTAAELARDGSEAARQVSETARDAAETAQGLAEDAHTAAADARDSSEAFRNASQAAKTASELARDQAQTKAAEADGSAQAASGHAQTAETHADDASQSATAAQAFSVSASLTATQLLPSDFSEGDRYWSSTWSGTPGEKPRSFPEANWEFTEVDGVPMAVFTAPTSASRALSTQGHLSVVEGRRYRMSIHARHVGPFVGGSDTFRVYFYRILSDFSSSGAHSSGTRSFSSSDQWETFTVDTTADGTVPFLNPFIQFREDQQGQPGPVIQIRAIVTEDITESENAAGHASAASDFAQSASVHADDAGQSAAATLGWRNQAETAAGQAETYRDEAATSETNAAGSASTATTQAGVATSAANAAGDSAGAAASSASSASSSANEAGQQAAAATTARTGAETARGGAETAASNASQSAEDADGHRASAANSASAAANSANTAGQAANAASGHAQTAESHADDASQSATAAQAFSVAASASRDSARDIILTSPVAPINFQNGTEYWTNSRNGNPLTVANSNGELVTDDPVFGTALDWVPSGSSGPGNLLTKTLFPWGGGKVYRVTLRFRVISSESSDVSIGVQVARTDDTYTDTSNTSSGSQPFPIDGEDKSLTAIVSDRSGPGIDDSWSSDGLPWVRFGWRHAQPGQSNLRLASCLVEDITSEYEALQSANAASDFAQTAEAYADDAEQSASASLGWRNQAQTARGEAQTFRNEAATSASTATSAASTATTQAGIATQAATDAGQAANAASGHAQTAESHADDASQSATAAQAFSVSANLGLNSTSKLLVTRPIPELMAFGNTYSGLPENYGYRPPGHSRYGSDSDGPYISQITTSSNNYIGHRALVSVDASSVLRIKFTAKKSPAVNLRMRLFFTSGPGTSDYLRIVNVNVPMPNDETVGTHTLVFAREAATGVTDTGGTASDWNDCVGVRVTLNNSNAVSDGYFQLYGLEVEDIAAEIQANAASEFTQSAAAHADDAGEYAAATLGWRNQAETAAGHAESYAESAATSATNAEGSASTASQASGLSVSATRAARPSTFEAGFIGWGVGGGGSPNSIGEPSSQWSVSTTAGEVRVNDLPGSSQLAPHWLMQRGVIAVSPGDSVRISATWRTSGAGNSSEDGAALRWEWLDADYNTVGSSTFSTQSANNTSFEVRSDVREAPAGAVFCRIGIYVRSVWGSSSKVFRVIRVDGENITSEVRSEASAQASFDSEEAAYAYADAAGESAGAAALSALNAGTSLTNAELAREDAVQAAEDADGSARSSAASLLRVRSSLNTSGIIDHFIGVDEDGNDVPSLDAFCRADGGSPNNASNILIWQAGTNRNGDFAALLMDPENESDGSSRRLATRGVLTVTPGDTVEVYGRLSASGSGTTGRVDLGIRWLDDSYNAILWSTDVVITDLELSVTDYRGTSVAPLGARYARPYVRHRTGWIGRRLEVARLGAHNITRVTNAQAQADAAYTVATDTESSLAQITQTVTAEYGSWSAFATDTATAIATIDTIAARRTLGVSAGSNEASLTLLAWDDAGDGGSAIMLNAQNVIMSGTVSMRHLVIGSTDNIILNAELDDLDGWDVDSEVNGPFTPPTDMVSRRSVTMNSGISSNTYIRWPTTVEAGRSYYMSMEARNTGSSSYSRLRFYIQWYDRNNNNIANSSGTTYIKTTVAPEFFRESFVAPAGAVRARFLFGRLSHASNNGTTHIGSPVVRLMNDGQLTVDGSIAARHMDVESLAADSAFIGNLNITEANISGDFTSDNYQESGGNPTIGFKLERSTGLIKGVGFVDAQGLIRGSATNYVGADTSGEFGNYNFDNNWHVLHQINLGTNAIRDIWRVNAGCFLRYQTITNGMPAPDTQVLAQRRSYFRVQRRLTPVGGSAGSWENVSSDYSSQPGDEGGWYYNFDQTFGGRWDNIQYRIQVGTQQTGGHTGDEIPLFRDAVITAERSIR